MIILQASDWSILRDGLWSEVMVSISHDNPPPPALVIRHNSVNRQQVKTTAQSKGHIKKTYFYLISHNVCLSVVASRP